MTLAEVSDVQAWFLAVGVVVIAVVSVIRYLQGR